MMRRFNKMRYGFYPYRLEFNLTFGVGFRNGAGGRGAVLIPVLGPRPSGGTETRHDPGPEDYPRQGRVLGIGPAQPGRVFPEDGCLRV